MSCTTPATTSTRICPGTRPRSRRTPSTSCARSPRDAHGEKLRYFGALLTSAGWTITHVAYPIRVDGTVTYLDLSGALVAALNADPARLADAALMTELDGFALDQSPGEFYKRPLFTCAAGRDTPCSV